MEHTPVPKQDIILDGTILDGAALNDAGDDNQINGRQPSRALVPLAGEEHPRATGYAITHPNPSFVAHLIATATHAPQTRTLCRASPTDAQASYRSVIGQIKLPVRPAGTPRVA